jgi:multidrug efflux pump subunit AcrA (membrane-fusion protein)
MTLRRQLALQALSESQLAELEYREEKASYARTIEIYSNVPEGQEIEEDSQTFIAESKAQLKEKKARYHKLRRLEKTPK